MTSQHDADRIVFEAAKIRRIAHAINELRWVGPLLAVAERLEGAAELVRREAGGVGA